MQLLEVCKPKAEGLPSTGPNGTETLGWVQQCGGMSDSNELD